MMNKKLKKQNGITLIALVITIIVMLVLVAVTINMAVNGGLFNYAGKATSETQNAIDAENELASGKIKVNEVWYNSIDEYLDEIESGGIGEDAIDWEQIIADLPTKYAEYLTLAQNKGQDTQEDIGIGTDGEVVNLDLWHYYKTDDGTGMSLGKLMGSHSYIGYNNENLDNGKIQGKMPQYIYIKSENEVYPVTTLECTFKATEIVEFPQIPSTVARIGDQAFTSCTSLTSVAILNSVTSIGVDAFNGCTSLTSVTIPSSVTSIGRYAFAYCTNLASVTIPSSVTSIGNDAFRNVPHIVYSGTATGSPWGALEISEE